jgi:hypothetical protein
MKLHREKALREILASEDTIETAVNGQTAQEQRQAGYAARREAELDALGRWMNSKQRRNLRKTLERANAQED